MAEYVFDYDGWAAAMSESVGPAWAYGLYRAIAKVMHGRKREEVMRCRDCKHYTEDEAEYYHYCGSWCEQVEPDGFCKWGEPREEA